MFSTVSGADHAVVAVSNTARTNETRARLTAATTWDIQASTGIIARRYPSGAAEWSSYSVLYDRYKVNAMRVRVFFPKAMALGDTVWTGSTAADSVVAIPHLVTAFYDNDQITGLPTTYGPSSQYATAAFSAPDGEFSYSVTLPMGQQYTNSLTGSVMLSSEWTDMATPDTLYGAVAMNIDLLVGFNGAGTYPGFTTCPVIYEYDVTFQGRR